MSETIFLLNGPNLNLLGKREPDIYGHETLTDIENGCRKHGLKLGYSLECRQSNFEGELVTWIQEAREAAAAIILNAGAYTHTSVAIHDALRAFDGFKVELHISNPHTREKFRHTSYVGPASNAVIAGFGTVGYIMALDAVAVNISSAN